MRIAKFIVPTLVGLVGMSMANARVISIAMPSDVSNAPGNYFTHPTASGDYFTSKPSSASDLSTAPRQFDSSVSPISDKRGPLSTSSFVTRLDGKHWLGGSSGAVYEVDPAGSVRAAAAIPGGDTWMMLFVGIGLVASQLRRKQKSLQHPLAT